tara:strand:- start:37 stop:681 length:645 start_codon:yes stop_codon:yes gene_type:complete
MINKVKVSLSEKILFVFLILLFLITFSSYFLLKDKCLFVKKINLNEVSFANKENIVVMNVECGNVIIELDPAISPNSVERFKSLIKNGSYDGSTFYRVIKDTLIQAGDLEYGNIDDINYTKIGTGKSGLGLLKSELSDEFEFKKGSVAFARKDNFDTEDSEFFITLKDIPIYQGEYTPLGKVIYGIDALEKIKSGNKSAYVLRPDYINYFKLLD